LVLVAVDMVAEVVSAAVLADVAHAVDDADVGVGFGFGFGFGVGVGVTVGVGVGVTVVPFFPRYVLIL